MKYTFSSYKELLQNKINLYQKYLIIKYFNLSFLIKIVKALKYLSLIHEVCILRLQKGNNRIV